MDVGAALVTRGGPGDTGKPGGGECLWTRASHVLILLILLLGQNHSHGR